MTLKALFTIAAAVTAFMGVSWLLFPGAMLTQWSVSPNPLAEYIGRRYAAMFFGYSVIAWLAREASDSPARRAIVAGAFALNCANTAVTLFGLATAAIGPAAWFVVILEAFLAVGFGYFLFSERRTIAA